MVEQGTRLAPLAFIVDDFTLAQIKTLFDCGFFTIKNGKAVVHFNNLGIIAKVERQDVLLREQTGNGKVIA